MKLRKAMIILVTAALLMGLLGGTFSAQAADVAGSRQIGDNVFATIYNDGLLEISGTGAMWDLVTSGAAIGGPEDWARSGELLYNNEGTAVGVKSSRDGMNHYFVGLMNPDGSIGWAQNIKVTNVVVDDGITYIGANAFKGTSIESITIPESVTELDKYALYDQQRILATFNVRFSEQDSFNPTGHSATIYAPEGTAAEEYAAVHEINFVAVAEEETQEETPETPQEEQQEETPETLAEEQPQEQIPEVPETPQAEAPAADGSLVRGMTGEAVAALQQKLSDLGYEVGAVDGDFGAMTEAAVIAFQKANDLWVDGVAGPMTMEALKTAAPAAPEAPAEEESQEPVSTEVNQLAYGAAGTAVLNLQKQLTDLGYYSGGLDGDFGAVTEAAVYEFQQANGLWVDGVAGPQTLGALANNPVPKYAAAPSGDPAPAAPEAEAASATRYLVYGMTGDDVTAVQSRLAELGFEVGAVDGYFGDYTYNAVIAFQNYSGLLVDGEVGDYTLAALGLR
ncbi:MAG: peptidoglycan-binding protein [Parasporobacterium sp.]|nr:peptidoglycan-binding protein [Parasporobacterium sp.]